MTDPFLKLQNLLLDLGDILIPYDQGGTWGLVDEDDNQIAEGETLKEACQNLPEELYGWGD